MAKTTKAAGKPVASKTKKAVAAPTKAAAAPVKPLKEALTKSGLVAHLAGHSGVEPKSIKLVLASLEATIAAAIHKKGIGQFTLPGLLKVTSQAIPAKPKRKGKDPFTGEERVFAAKPATVRVKVRPLKKLKDAAL
jgi:nucleoid DNA-binding protein